MTIDGPLTDSIEGCLSLKNKEGSLRFFKVKRYKKVRVTGKMLLTDKDLKLIDLDKELDGLMGTVYQHEIDHHRGILISDIGEELHLYA